MRPRQWQKRVFDAEAKPPHYLVYIEGEGYSPDRSWIVVGAGASTRLRNYLNRLESLKGSACDHEWMGHPEIAQLKRCTKCRTWMLPNGRLESSKLSLKELLGALSE